MNQNRICRPILTTLFYFLVFSPISAQIRLAAWGGIHSSNFIQKNSFPGFDSAFGQYYSSKTGFEIGVLAEIPFGKNNLYFQPAFFIARKEINISDTMIHPCIRLIPCLVSIPELNYVVLPLYLTGKPRFQKQKNYFI